MLKRRGVYLGTEIDGKWWKRYTKGGFFVRGAGACWCDDEALYFRRYLMKHPITILFRKVQAVETSTWHAGRWFWGRPIVKLLWEHEGESLGSGFVLSSQKAESQRLLNEIRQRVSSAAESGA